MEKNLLIKSQDRKTGSSHNFLYYSHEGLDGDYILKYCMIANTLYNVNEYNNTFTLNENSTDKTVTLTSGNYTASTFETELKTALDVASSGYNTFTVTYNETTGKINVTASNAFNFIFPDSRTSRLYGFDILQTASGTDLTSPNIINLSFPNSIGIEIRETNIDNYENCNTNASGAFYIPIDQSFGFYKTLDEHTFTQHIVFKKARYLNFRVVDTSTNDPLDLNGGDFEILLSNKL